ncbi:uncharacterized protein TNCV_3264551 [Trichonephila clavipes]|nr:uncharacterized protein TNCV_3264551 [Trichonephila clavipes]
MSNRKEAVFATQAVISIGAIWTAALPMLGTQAVLERFQQLIPKILLSEDGYRLGGRDVDMIPKLSEIIEGIEYFYTRAFGDGPRNFEPWSNDGTTPELAPPLLTTTPHQWEDVSALDRFNVHRCPTRRVFSGTGIELVTRQAMIRYLYHSATAATSAVKRLNMKYDACRRQIYRPISAKRNRRTTAQQVANQFLAASGTQISRKTFARRLRGGGLYARRPVVCVPLTRQHPTARLQWCREHHNWTEQDLDSYYSQMRVGSVCHRIVDAK